MKIHKEIKPYDGLGAYHLMIDNSFVYLSYDDKHNKGTVMKNDGSEPIVKHLFKLPLRIEKYSLEEILSLYPYNIVQMSTINRFETDYEFMVKWFDKYKRENKIEEFLK